MVIELFMYYIKLYESYGVKIIIDVQVLVLYGEGNVQQVMCNNNLMLDVDMVIIGIGVIFNIEFVEVVGLEVGNGIIVD